MIFDCFTFNGEFDLLEIRLMFLNSVVDKFVIIESEFTFSGNQKPLYYKLNANRFKKFHNKIMYASIPIFLCNKSDAWQNEYFQRNFVKETLQEASDEDIIHLSDLDEIPNLPLILKRYIIDKPYLIEIPIYYYFFNLKSNDSFKANLLTPYKYIKNFELGKRENYFSLTQNFITMADIKTGWHFSYLFGYDVTKYQQKIKSFSHTEYNNAFYLNERRVYRCVKLGIDLYERELIYKVTNYNNDLKQLLPIIMKSGMRKYLFDRKKYRLNDINDFIYFLRLEVKPRLKMFARPCVRAIRKYFNKFKVI